MTNWVLIETTATGVYQRFAIEDTGTPEQDTFIRMAQQLTLQFGFTITSVESKEVNEAVLLDDLVVLYDFYTSQSQLKGLKDLFILSKATKPIIVPDDIRQNYFQSGDKLKTFNEIINKMGGSAAKNVTFIFDSWTEAVRGLEIEVQSDNLAERIGFKYHSLRGTGNQYNRFDEVITIINRGYFISKQEYDSRFQMFDRNRQFGDIFDVRPNGIQYYNSTNGQYYPYPSSLANVIKNLINQSYAANELQEFYFSDSYTQGNHQNFIIYQSLFPTQWTDSDQAGKNVDQYSASYYDQMKYQMDQYWAIEIPPEDSPVQYNLSINYLNGIQIEDYEYYNSDFQEYIDALEQMIQQYDRHNYYSQSAILSRNGMLLELVHTQAFIDNVMVFYNRDSDRNNQVRYSPLPAVINQQFQLNQVDFELFDLDGLLNNLITICLKKQQFDNIPPPQFGYIDEQLQSIIDQGHQYIQNNTENLLKISKMVQQKFYKRTDQIFVNQHRNILSEYQLKMETLRNIYLPIQHQINDLQNNNNIKLFEGSQTSLNPQYHLNLVDSQFYNQNQIAIDNIVKALRDHEKFEKIKRRGYNNIIIRRNVRRRKQKKRLEQLQ